jgi:hypothetical protein
VQTSRVISRLSDAEFHGYLQLVQQLETSRSRMFRGMVREALGMGPDLIRQDMNNLREGIYQLGAIGRNLNQQLRALHSGQLLGRPADMTFTTGPRGQAPKHPSNNSTSDKAFSSS